MEIPFAGQITQADYLQAQALHNKASKAPLVLGTIAGAMLITTGLASFSEPAIFGTALPVIAFLAILAVATWWALRFQAINNWKKSKTFQNPFSGTITSNRIHFDAAYSESSQSWEVYIHYKQSPTMILLYQSPNLMNIFPKKFFKSDQDWEAFIKLVQENILEKKTTAIEKIQKFSLVGFGILLLLLAIISFLFTLFGSPDR
jgi:hypothetical protein